MDKDSVLRIGMHIGAVLREFVFEDLQTWVRGRRGQVQSRFFSHFGPESVPMLIGASQFILSDQNDH